MRYFLIFLACAAGVVVWAQDTPDASKNTQEQQLLERIEKLERQQIVAAVQAKPQKTPQEIEAEALVILTRTLRALPSSVMAKACAATQGERLLSFVVDGKLAVGCLHKLK